MVYRGVLKRVVCVPQPLDVLLPPLLGQLLAPLRLVIKCRLLQVLTTSKGGTQSAALCKPGSGTQALRVDEAGQCYTDTNFDVYRP